MGAFSDNIRSTILYIVLRLIYIGFGIFLREKIYHENVSKNFMGTINTFVFIRHMLSLSIGFLGGFFLMLQYYPLPIYLDRIYYIIAGLIIVFLPSVRKAFTNNKFLYYSSPVLAGMLATLRIITILPE